jgi:hypothetical protein
VAPYPSTRPTSTAEASTASASQPTPTQSHTARIKLSDDVVAQSIKSAMRLVTREVFGRGAMAIDKNAKKAMLCKVITDCVPRCFAPNGMFTIY